MKWTEEFDCPCCEMPVVMQRTDYGKNTIAERDCAEDCTHTDAQVLEAFEEHVVSQSEKAFERTLSGDHGGPSLSEQIEKSRRIKRQM